MNLRTSSAGIENLVMGVAYLNVTYSSVTYFTPNYK